MPVTIQDVAAQAGVSPSTVSRVINKNHDISSATAAAVEAVILQLGYRRTATRRGRRPARRHPATRIRQSFALLIPDANMEAMQTPLTGQLAHGAEAVARALNFNFLLTRLAEDGGLPPCLAPVQVDGLIVRSEPQPLQAVLPAIPTVWVFNPAVLPSHGDMVYPDNEAIGHMALDYLLARGHRHLAVVNAWPEHPEAQVRTAAFVRLAQDAGHQVRLLTGDCHELKRDMDVAAQELLTVRPAITGVFLPLGDAQLEHFYRALQKRGSKAVALISCNNDRARLWALDPRLVNIDIRADEIGRAAVETLRWRMRHLNDPRRRIMIEPRLEAAQN